MKTDRQISNAHTRAAKLARDVALNDQLQNFAATDKQMAEERGAAMCAAGFAASALGKLENGDYEGFLSCMRLAAGFAKDASEAHGNRRPKINTGA
jgi:hypothetical protein